MKPITAIIPHPRCDQIDPFSGLIIGAEKNCIGPNSWEGWIPAAMYEGSREKCKQERRPIEHAMYSPKDDAWYVYIPKGRV